MSSRRGSFAELVALAERAGQSEALPALARAKVFGRHACRVAGATFLAFRGIPMAVIQLLGRWSSRAIERYTQSAPLALAPSAPSHALAGTAPGGSGGGAQLAVPLALADATTDAGQPDEGPGAQLAAPASPQEAPQEEAGPSAGLPGVQFVPAVRPGRAVPEADRGPEHFIYLARTRRLHKPDPDEANADRAAWRAVGCGWPYGGRQFFRLSAPPPGAAFCRRCFTAGLEGCSEAVESSSGSSSRASGSSPSSHRASSTSESGGSTSDS